MTSPLERVLARPELAAAVLSRLPSRDAPRSLAALACTSKAVAAAVSPAWVALCTRELGANSGRGAKAAIVGALLATRGPRPGAPRMPWPAASLRFVMQLRDQTGALLCVLTAVPSAAAQAQAAVVFAAAPVARRAFTSGDTATLLLERDAGNCGQRVTCLLSAPTLPSGRGGAKASYSAKVACRYETDYEIGEMMVTSRVSLSLSIRDGLLDGRVAFWAKSRVADPECALYGEDKYEPSTPVPLSQLHDVLATAEWF